MKKKVERNKRIFLLLSSSLLFLLLILLTTNLFQKQLAWNQFKQTFSIKDAALYENNVAIGLNGIIQGEEALGILQKLDSQIKKPSEEKEFLLVSINIKNLAKKEQSIDPIKISVFVKGLQGQEERDYDPINITLPDQGEYKRFDTAVMYQPGEVRNGTFCFEISKGAQVDHFFMMRPTFGTIWIDQPIHLNKILELIFCILFFLLLLIMLLLLSFQRKRRSDGKKEFDYFILIMGFLSVISSFYYWYAGFPMWFYLGFALSAIIFFTLLFFKRRRVLLDLNFISKKDRLKLIDDFEVKMGWVKTPKMEIRKCIEVFNPNNQDSYLFYRGNSVSVNHPTEETIKAKEVLLDLYCATKFDWTSFLWTIFILNALSIYFILRNFSHFD
jgi:hypothetical protein